MVHVKTGESTAVGEMRDFKTHGFETMCFGALSLKKDIVFVCPAAVGACALLPFSNCCWNLNCVAGCGLPRLPIPLQAMLNILYLHRSRALSFFCAVGLLRKHPYCASDYHVLGAS